MDFDKSCVGERLKEEIDECDLEGSAKVEMRSTSGLKSDERGD